MIDFNALGPFEITLLSLSGYMFSAMLGFIWWQRERENSAVIAALQEKAAKGMAKAQKKFDATVYALRQSFQAILEVATRSRVSQPIEGEIEKPTINEDPASMFHASMETIMMQASCVECGKQTFDVLRSQPCPYCFTVDAISMEE